MFDFRLLDCVYSQETPGEAKERTLRKTVADEEIVAWDPKMPFRDALHIDASTYKQPSIFDVKPCTAANPNNQKNKKKTLAISKGGNWCYRERLLDAGDTLWTISGNRQGVVRFNGTVKIPMIHSMTERRGWRGDPWMSFTPMEFFTLRPGTKLAKGHTIIAGLGMGYQLEQVCKKRSVKKVTLIEQDQEIVDWIFPRLDLNGKEVDVIVGDANELLPKMTADVALIDIYKGYGENGRDIRRKISYSKDGKIGKVWVWGSASIG